MFRKTLIVLSIAALQIWLVAGSALAIGIIGGPGGGGGFPVVPLIPL